MAVNIEARLTTRARALALLFADGQITPDQLRDQLRPLIEEAHAIALLAGTGGQRNADIDAALRDIIASEVAELDRLIALIERDTDLDIERRLLAFADTLDETQAEGERLTADDGVSPLVPLAVGGALGALLQRIGQAPASTRQVLPRVDSRQLVALRDLLNGRMDALADDLASGALSLDDWHERMQREILIDHSLYAQVGGGDVSNERVSRQFDFLNNWRNQLSTQETISAEAMKVRAHMYVDNGQASLQEAATARIGLPVLPAYPKDGTTICRSNDRCWWRIEVLDGSGNFDCHWMLRPAEHCETCVRRAAVWNPVQVRNGVLQPFETIGVFAI